MPARTAAAIRNLLCLLVVVMLRLPATCVASPFPPASGVAATYQFHIEAGPLSQALEAFTDVTGARVVAPAGASLDGLSTEGVVGIYTADGALDILVSGTGLQPRRARRARLCARGSDARRRGSGDGSRPA